MAAFELPEGPRSINGGANGYEVRQLFPQTSAISGVRVGVSGAATGITTFQWNDDSRWWLPSSSYFNIRGHFTDTSGNALTRTSGIAYCDNWCSALFQQIQYFINGGSVELLQFPAQSDTALLYASVDKTWLESFGSVSGVGEAFTTRQLNSAITGSTAANYNEVVAAYRPALSIFDHCSGIPTGAQHRIDFSWSNTAEQNVIESTSSKVAGTDYYFYCDEFTFYKASITPDPSIDLPISGVIELNPVTTVVYPLSAGSTQQVNVPLPSTCHRILVGVQDNNSANNFAAGQNGYAPITSFRGYVSNGATANNVSIQNLYMSFPELGYQAPNPTYSLTGPTSAGSKSEWQRAFSDFITYCRGASGGYEGSCAMGTSDLAIGAAVLAPLASTPVMTLGDPNNRQQAWIPSTSTGAVSSTQATQTAAWGWMGRCPGPIFAFPCVRPVDKLVTNANLYMQFTGAVTSVNVYVMMSYSMAIAVEKGMDGKYQFQIMRGL